MAQSIVNVKASFVEGKVSITYDLVGGNSDQKYVVSLFGSHDNYTKPLMSVSGDIGQEISPGNSKSIEWNAQVDLSEYKGSITFRVRAEPIALAYSFVDEPSGYRRGKTGEIQWQGGSASDNVTIELLRNGSVVQQVFNNRNSGNTNWSVSQDMEKGTGYQFRLRSSNGQAITGNTFAVKSKVPLALKIVPVLVVGGVAAALLGGGGDPDPGTSGNDLPVAPAAPN